MKLPKLHIRDLFWLVLVCGIGCRWWIDHRWLLAEIDRLTPPFRIVVLSGDDLGCMRMRDLGNDGGFSRYGFGGKQP